MFWGLAAFLVLVFLTGGGARADIQSLLILRPAAAIACGAALWALPRDTVREHRVLLALAGAVLMLPLLHLVPLPPAVWRTLPGRDVMIATDAAAGLEGVWRPLSMVPGASWNAFFALLVPLAVLLLGLRVDGRERFALLPLVIVMGLISGLVGLLQAIGDPQGSLYFYRVTNNGAAVGLFSNRNHQAIMLALMFPMLAVYAAHGGDSEERLRIRSLAALGAGILVVPLLLVTGSRIGLALGVLGLMAAALLYRRPVAEASRRRGRKGIDFRLPLLVGGVLALGAVTLLSSRAESINRLTAPDETEELRFKVWGPIADSGWTYFPAGSGIGSFVEVHRIDEPVELLRPTYLNHAHNDWLELFMTGGLPALVVFAAALAWLAFRGQQAFRSELDSRGETALARLGAVLIVMLLIGSMADYPARTPTLAAMLALAAVWLDGATAARRRGSRRAATA